MRIRINTKVLRGVLIGSILLTLLLVLLMVIVPAYGNTSNSTTYCTPNFSVAPLPNTQSGNFNSTNQVCFVVQNAGPLGFNCSNMQGRTVTVNGTSYDASTCTGSVTAPNTNGGQYYFDVSAGGLSYASIAFWAEGGSGGSGSSGGTNGACTATLSAGQKWSDRYNLNVSVTGSDNWKVTMTYPNQEKMIATWNINASWPQSNVLVATPNGSGNNWGVTIKPNGNWTWPTVTCETDQVSPYPIMLMVGLPEDYDTGTLAQAAALHGKYFGGVSDNPNSTVSTHFSAITPENAGKWDSMEPSKGSFSFGTMDNIVNFAKAQDPPLVVRGHTLVWSKQLPSWVGNYKSDAAGMKTVIRDHINGVLNHALSAKWNLYAIDVVNEGFMQDGSRRPKGMPPQGDFSSDLSPFEQALPGYNYVPGGTTQHTKDDWIYVAFRAARDNLKTWPTDNRPLLCYNDFEIENVNAKSDAIYEEIQWLNSVDGDRLVDCIGMQAHFREDEVSHRPNAIPDEWTSGKTVLDNMERFANLGLEIQVTELDVRASMGAYTPPNGHKVTQDDAFRIITEACLRTPMCSGISQWGVLDTGSWIGAAEAPLLLDGSGNKKAVYTTVYNVLLKNELTLLPAGYTPGGTTTIPATISDGSLSCYSGDHDRCTWLYGDSSTVTFTGTCQSGSPGGWDVWPLWNILEGCASGSSTCKMITDYTSFARFWCHN